MLFRSRKSPRRSAPEVKGRGGASFGRSRTSAGRRAGGRRSWRRVVREVPNVCREALGRSKVVAAQRSGGPKRCREAAFGSKRDARERLFGPQVPLTPEANEGRRACPQHSRGRLGRDARGNAAVKQNRAGGSGKESVARSEVGLDGRGERRNGAAAICPDRPRSFSILLENADLRRGLWRGEVSAFCKVAEGLRNRRALGRT